MCVGILLLDFSSALRLKPIPTCPLHATMVLTYFNSDLLSWGELIQRYESITNNAELQETDDDNDDDVNQVH
jgi:hypothetical protein